MREPDFGCSMVAAAFAMLCALALLHSISTIASDLDKIVVTLERPR